MKKKVKIFALILFLLLFIFRCEEPYSSPEIELISYTCKYSITGTAKKVFVTIENEYGNTSQYSDISVPWNYSFEAPDGMWVYCSAQNQGESGSVTVTIYRDNVKFTSSTSSGAYVIATASGTL